MPDWPCYHSADGKALAFLVAIWDTVYNHLQIGFIVREGDNATGWYVIGAAHWVYLAGVAVIVLTMILRANVVVPSVVATFAGRHWPGHTAR